MKIDVDLPTPTALFSPAPLSRQSVFRPNKNKHSDNIASDGATTEQGRALQMSLNGSGVYCPEELSLFGHVLNQAVKSLPTVMRTPGNRAEIARNIWLVLVSEIQLNLSGRP